MTSAGGSRTHAHARKCWNAPWPRERPAGVRGRSWACRATWNAAAAGLYNLYLYNIDDLGEIVEQNKKRARGGNSARAEAIIAEHVAKFETWRAALEAGSIVDDLARPASTSSAKQLLRETLQKCRRSRPRNAQRIARITEELIERVLDEPAERLRTARGMRGRLGAVEALRHIFGLDRDEDGESDGEVAAHRHARQRAGALAGESHHGQAGGTARRRGGTGAHPHHPATVFRPRRLDQRRLARNSAARECSSRNSRTRCWRGRSTSRFTA